MSNIRTDYEIDDKRRRVGVEIEIILLNAILKSLKKVNSPSHQMAEKENDADYIPF